MVSKEATVMIDGLSTDASRECLAREFELYGRVKRSWVARNPPGLGFITFEDGRDAPAAVERLNGKRVCGSKVRVQLTRN
mmetsp:Transcript_34949/g.58537  ORF Transcript_34949/g.58537 Transcript_34949/m.58537 type:complete len:80 (-) Transcript_34949:448-687(-)